MGASVGGAGERGFYPQEGVEWGKPFISGILPFWQWGPQSGWELSQVLNLTR